MKVETPFSLARALTVASAVNSKPDSPVSASANEAE